jgi:benzoyl-CoA reductase subunit B
VRLGKGPVTPDGDMGEEKYRLVVEGPPNWTSFREFWKMFYDEGAVVVSSTYAKVGGLYDFGFRHDPDHPLESLAEYCLGCYTNLNLPSRVNMICKYIDEYQADGLLINSIKSCNSFSAGQLLMPARGREAHRQAGRVHRDRPGRPALLLGGQRQEPAGELLPDGQAEAHLRPRRPGNLGPRAPIHAQ